MDWSTIASIYAGSVSLAIVLITAACTGAGDDYRKNLNFILMLSLGWPILFLLGAGVWLGHAARRFLDKHKAKGI